MSPRPSLARQLAASPARASHGFELVSADDAPRWGRERIVYQRYELDLSRAPARLSA
jgi:hypothetical protein